MDKLNNKTKNTPKKSLLPNNIVKKKYFYAAKQTMHIGC